MRKIDFKEKQFECGGRTFYLQDSLSFNRYRELQRLSIEFGFSRTFIDLYKALDRAEGFLNKVQLVDAAVELRNAKIGVAMLEEKEDPALRVCTLFLNEADEDVTIIDEVKMKDKIECWSKELDVTPFFQLAASIVPDWRPAYEVTSLLTLKKESQAKK